MKINWGTGIVITFVLFMTFILYFVFKVQSDSKYDNELVTEDYYQKELLVQGNIEKQRSANKLEHQLSFKKTKEGILVIFPKEFDYRSISGKVSLYRPSSQKLDFEIPISLSSSNLLIPNSNLISGLWDITVDWSFNNTNYLNKETMYY